MGQRRTREYFGSSVSSRRLTGRRDARGKVFHYGEGLKKRTREDSD